MDSPHGLDILKGTSLDLDFDLDFEVEVDLSLVIEVAFNLALSLINIFILEFSFSLVDNFTADDDLDDFSDLYLVDLYLD